MGSSYQAHFAVMYPHRPIRSFVLRAGRVTAAQERALADLWPKYGLDTDDRPLDLDAAFARGAGSRTARRCLEIGFGAGEVIGALARMNPDVDYLGIEVHRAGIGRLLLSAAESQLENLRVVCRDAVEVLESAIGGEAFDDILIFFPDPWHKKRHHKRRLIDAEFVALLAARMKRGAVLRLATDWQEYAEQMLAVCNANARLETLSADRTYVARPAFRPATRFERRGERLGHGVWDLAYRRLRD
ncbi:MAG: tRNA (guanosine(46)-N7)-methyltransferase TrmB [Pseudomonadota bacterium]|nr:tRNA (guanosine(46)-N7)-methyltransferase TrmB [Pseudomonadota bacterium]